MRIGHGYDAHRTKTGIPLFIGGVRIDSDFGLEAHSDGDVLIHALIDALLGAAGMRDIGFYFPDRGDEYKDADSKELLEKTVRLIEEKGLAIEYADCTLIAQKPKLGDYIEKMRMSLSSIMSIDKSRVNVKATTEEKMGFTGSGEGICAHAVCLLAE